MNPVDLLFDLHYRLLMFKYRGLIKRLAYGWEAKSDTESGL